MSPPASHSLDVPGAQLYYEVQGAGPLLMMVGHPMGASGFAAIAPLLAEEYTVVTYDPRGFERSTIDDPDQEAEPGLLADDARRILEAVGGAPAVVFGSSGGAITGLALVVKHSAHVRMLVAHEPPVVLQLPEAEEARAGLSAVYDAYRNGGVGAAWARFGVFTGMSPSAGNSDDEAPPPAPPDADPTSKRFFEHALFPIALYEPDIASLKAASSRIVVGGGTESKGQLAQRAAAALAEQLGTPLLDFPGGHGGFASDAKAFAGVLRSAIA